MTKDDYLAAIIEDINDGEVESAVDYILDMMQLTGDDVTQEDINTIMAAAQEIDPTFSGDGAWIRDALRNNTSFTIA